MFNGPNPNPAGFEAKANNARNRDVMEANAAFRAEEIAGPNTAEWTSYPVVTKIAREFNVSYQMVERHLQDFQS